MQNPLQAARELASHHRQAKGLVGQGGVVILLDGHFVGWLAALPPAAEWAPGCLAVAETSQVHLARAAGFRGEVEWLDLGAAVPAPESPPPAPPESSTETPPS